MGTDERDKPLLPHQGEGGVIRKVVGCADVPPSTIRRSRRNRRTSAGRGTECRKTVRAGSGGFEKDAPMPLRPFVRGSSMSSRRRCRRGRTSRHAETLARREGAGDISRGVRGVRGDSGAATCGVRDPWGIRRIRALRERSSCPKRAQRLRDFVAPCDILWAAGAGRTSRPRSGTRRLRRGGEAGHPSWWKARNAWVASSPM